MDVFEGAATASGKALIDQLWSRIAPDGRVLRGDIQAWIEEAGRQNGALPTPLLDELAVFDEHLCFMAHVSTALLFEPEEPSQERIVLGSLAGSITALLFSVRHLVVAGFDVAAKVLMRSVAEHADILFFLIVNPDKVGEYAGVDSFKAANEFWHRSLKGWKARRGAFEALGAGNTTSDWFRELETYQRQEEEVMALAAHGAYIAVFRAAFPEVAEDERKTPIRWAGYLGKVTLGSVRTLEYVGYALFPIYASSVFPFGKRGDREPVAAAEGSKLALSIEARRHVLVELMAAASTPDDHHTTDSAQA